MQQIVKLEWQGSPPDLYCPACGTPIYEMGKELKRCQHVMFTFIDTCGEFDYVNEKIKPQAQKIMERAYEEEIDPVMALLKAIESRSVLCFSIRTSGIACAPVNSTVYVAIEFNPE